MKITTTNEIFQNIVVYNQMPKVYQKKKKKNALRLPSLKTLKGYNNRIDQFVKLYTEVKKKQKQTL